MIVPHSRPTIDLADIRAVSDVLTSGMIAQGKKVEEFENAIAKFVGMKYGVAVSSGTSALHLALVGLGVGPGDEVIIPSYVCSSPYLAVSHTGATPKVVDINRQDFNISAAAAKEQLTQKTKAIIVPHMFGTSAELDELSELGVPLVEDCAQSLGAQYKGRSVGQFGELSAFSFYATKMITTGEGGMIITDNEALYSKIVESRDYDKKPLTPVKYNYKMTDFQAALGLSQLKKLKHFVQRRIQLASMYSERLSRCEAELPISCSYKKPVFYRYVIMIDKRDKIQALVKKQGIICEKPIFEPLHRSLDSSVCVHSDLAYERALSIPLYPSLSDHEAEYVLSHLCAALRSKR